MAREPPQFVHLHGLNSERVVLGWRPRDARQRLARRVGWGDESWLRVHGEVKGPDGNWSFSDPAMIEHEARDLADFLDVRPWSCPRKFECIEPCLAFVAKVEEGGVFALGIRFRAEAAPPWIWGTDAQWTEGYTLEMQVADRELRQFTAGVRRLLGLVR
ncbi:MAG: hypothetical protein KIT68_02320 [Phycisphaeraceae bacterium]|nr:hypothetical protein [Phycisphaeraceae bacterium]